MEKKKKIRKRICLIIAVMFMAIALAIPFVFAVPVQINSNNQFFSVDSLTKTAGSMLEMKIDLEKISYSNFLFTLTSSNKTLENIDITNTNSNAEVEKENNSIIITGNKDAISVNEIKLYYPIPTEAKVGETFTFKATIEENKEESDKSNIENDTNEIENGEILVEQSKKEMVEITITIVEETNTENKNDKNNQDEQDKNQATSENNKQEQDKNPSNNKNNKENQNINNQKTNSNRMLAGSGNTNVTRIGNNSNGQSEIVVYNGSDNNYLKELSIKGYEMTTKFKKENLTYFIKLEEDVNSLNITAKAEHSEAKVCVYGNTNIKNGSKILISVTAENGSVRTYRIYVSK